jgi:hypothetical protein
MSEPAPKTGERYLTFLVKSHAAAGGKLVSDNWWCRSPAAQRSLASPSACCQSWPAPLLGVEDAAVLTSASSLICGLADATNENMVEPRCA